MSGQKAKKRKTSTPEKEDFSSPSIGEGTPHRKVWKAQRQSLGEKKNTGLILLKQQLYKKGVQDIMESEAFRGLFTPNGPRLSTALKDGHPQFVNASLTDLRWALAAIKDTYQRPTGDVIAMGQEDTGQLGMVKLIGKDKDNGFPPTLLQDLRGNIIQVACGGMHSVALTEDGTAYTWGCNDDGALGRTYNRNDDEEIHTTPPTPVEVMIPSRHAVSQHVVRSQENESRDVIAIDAGASHTTFLTISGNVYVSGSYKDVDSQHFSDLRPPDDDGKHDKGSGPGSVLGHRVTPVHVFQLPKRAKFIAAGGSINAAILEDDSLVTWGMGHSGQLARTKNVTDLRDSNGLVELGHPYYMRMKNGQKTYLEDLVKETFLTPKPVEWEIPGRRIVTHVSCGGEHILVAARTPGATSSRMYAAGGNAYGKLGTGDELPRHELVLVGTLKDVPIARVAAGLDHSLVLNDKGDTIYACGKAGYGQLGIPEDRMEQKHDSKELEGKGERFVKVPTRVSFPQTEKLDKIGRFVDIFCGENHSGAITSAGKIYTWGYGEYGQAGNDPTIHTEDLKQPRLNEDWLKDTDMCVHQGAGGSQHTLIVASRYKKTA